jgi:hypothetical protein
MQHNRGIAKILIIISSVLVLTAIVSAVLYFGKEEEVKEVTVDEVQKILTLDERAGGIISENVVITVSSGSFARGKLIDTSTGQEKDFYIMKIGEVWRVVEITDKPVSCERFARLGFPNIFIQDCQLTFSDAVTLSEIDATLDDFFKSASNVNLRIIATVESVEQTEDGQIITIDSGGEIIKIQLSENDPSIQEGDLLVTTITPPNSKSTNNVYTTTNSVVVNQEDKDLFEDVTTDNTNTVGNNTQVIENINSNKIYKINAPKTSAPPSYFKNIYDVDNSFVDVELDGSF